MREDHLVMFKNGTTKTQFDYFQPRLIDRMICKNCKVITSDSLMTLHKLFVIDVVFKG